MLPLDQAIGPQAIGQSGINPRKASQTPKRDINDQIPNRDSDLTYRSFLKQVPRFRYVVAQAFCELWATSARVMACWNICAALSYLGVVWL